MKIRTISLGTAIFPTPGLIKKLAPKLHRARDFFEKENYEVQTLRLVLGPWEKTWKEVDHNQRSDMLQEIDAALQKHEIDFCSLGAARSPEGIAELASVLSMTSRLSASALCADKEKGLNFKAMKQAVKVLLKLSESTAHGFGNFRFAAAFCVPTGVPFFPVACHGYDFDGFSLGLENSDLFVQAMGQAQGLENSRRVLEGIMGAAYAPLDKLCHKLEQKISVTYCGIDTSLSPSLKEEESLVKGFQAAGVSFGRGGTLALSAVITGVLKSLEIRRTGYCGLMLPVLEDKGLCRLADEGVFGIDQLLMYSAVCGVGIDTLPLPGDVSVEKIEALYADTAALALKWNKALSVRLLPIQGLSEGDKTDFHSPYMDNCRVFSL
jgi:uncharacterized protein (UPF0210 family)